VIAVQKHTKKKTNFFFTEIARFRLFQIIKNKKNYKKTKINTMPIDNFDGEEMCRRQPTFNAESPSSTPSLRISSNRYMNYGCPILRRTRYRFKRVFYTKKYCPAYHRAQRTSMFRIIF